MPGTSVRGYRFEIDAAAVLARLLARAGMATGSERMMQDWRARAAEAAPAAEEVPLREVARRFRLSNAEYDAVVLAVLAEAEPRLCPLISLLDIPQRRSRPTLGLALSLAADTYSDDITPLEVARHPVITRGLLELDGDGPLPDRTIRVHEDVARRLVSASPSDAVIPGLAVYAPEPGLHDRLRLDEEALHRASCWAATPGLPLLLVGPRGSGRRSLVRAALAITSHTLIAVELRQADRSLILSARREACWRGAALFVSVRDERDLADAWMLAADAAASSVPFALAVEPGLVDAARAAAPTPRSEVELHQSAAQRARAWRSHLRDHEIQNPDELRRLATKYRFTPGRAREAVEHARAMATLERGNDTLAEVAQLEAACRVLAGSAVSGLVRRLTPQYELDDLVVPENTLEELRLASAWLRHGHTVLDDWGFDRGTRGLTIMFTGPPGTGKTMAAQALARELGLDLYRVDISRLMSKYVGETEKNLAQIFDQARDTTAILFFDEADAVFGKRTETADAQDRYSNLETAYLLQRLEDHDGVVVLASNMRRNIDDAFARRLQFVVPFPMPAPDLRLRLWQQLLPPTAPRESPLDFRTIAEGFEMSGGEIRNALLAAAFLAAEERVPIGLRHIERGIVRELRKKGSVVDVRKLSTLATARP